MDGPVLAHLGHLVTGPIAYGLYGIVIACAMAVVMLLMDRPDGKDLGPRPAGEHEEEDLDDARSFEAEAE